MSNKEVHENNGSDMTNDEYRASLQKIFDGIDDNKLLQYFYIFVSEKIKRVS